jgi:hypothetical protein
MDDLRKVLYKPTCELIEHLEEHKENLDMESFARLEMLKAEVRIWEEQQRRDKAL